LVGITLGITLLLGRHSRSITAPVLFSTFSPVISIEISTFITAFNFVVSVKSFD
jgi:hypothetical protein